MQSFHPSYDDLGTPPRWRPYSWKKDKLQLTPKGAMLAYEREALEYRILKLAKAIKFL